MIARKRQWRRGQGLREESRRTSNPQTLGLRRRWSRVLAGEEQRGRERVLLQAECLAARRPELVLPAWRQNVRIGAHDGCWSPVGRSGALAVATACAARDVYKTPPGARRPSSAAQATHTHSQAWCESPSRDYSPVGGTRGCHWAVLASRWPAARLRFARLPEGVPARSGACWRLGELQFTKEHPKDVET